MMTELRFSIAVISINVNGLNSPIKIKRVSMWITDQDQTLCHI